MAFSAQASVVILTRLPKLPRAPTLRKEVPAMLSAFVHTGVPQSPQKKRWTGLPLLPVPVKCLGWPFDNFTFALSTWRLRLEELEKDAVNSCHLPKCTCSTYELAVLQSLQWQARPPLSSSSSGASILYSIAPANWVSLQKQYETGKHRIPHRHRPCTIVSVGVYYLPPKYCR